MTDSYNLKEDESNFKPNNTLESNLQNSLNIEEPFQNHLHINSALSQYSPEELESIDLITSPYILTEDGWSPSDIGTWDPQTRIATLIKEVNQSIDIQTDSVLLTAPVCDDYRYTIDGSINNLLIGILINGRDNITISNISVINCFTGIRIFNSDAITINENIFKNNKLHGILIDNSKYINVKSNDFIDNDSGVYTTRSKCVFIEKNLFTNGNDTIYLNQYVSSSKISNNLIYKNNAATSFYGISCISYNDFNTIENNRINVHNNELLGDDIYLYGIYFGSGNFNSFINNYISIEMNSIENIAKLLSVNIGGIQLVGYANGQNIISSNRISLNHNSIVVKDFTLYCRFEALLLSSTNNGLCICEYNKFSIHGNIISSTSKETVKILNSIYGSHLYSENGGSSLKNNCIEISKNSVTANNATIENNIYGLSLYGYNVGSLIEQNTISIKNNVSPSNSYCYGISFDNNNQGNLINSNTIKLLDNLTSIAYGIYFFESNSGNKIQNNILSNNQGTGIYFFRSNYENLIKENDLSNNSENGVYFGTSNLSNTIHSNCIKGNKLNGLYFNTENSLNDIYTNQINSSKQDGIVFNTNNSRNRINCNTISYNIDIGILFNSNNNENRVEYNMVKYNGNFGISINPTNLNNIIRYNCLDENFQEL